MTIGLRLRAGLAALAMTLLHAGWPALAAASGGAGFDASGFICGTGALDSEARAEVRASAEALGLAEPDSGPAYEAHDCPACVACAVPALPGAAELVAFTPVRSKTPGCWPAPLTGAGSAAGPPVGLRAPPRSA